MTSPALQSPLALGDTGLDFDDLPGADGGTYSYRSFGPGQVLVLVFVASGCPTVRYYRDRLAALQERYRGDGVQIVAVNANNPHLSPMDGIEEMRRRHAESPWAFPYLKDARGDLARRCGAICTPHAFLFDGDGRLRYRGRIDDSRTGRRVEHHDLEQALEDVLAGRPVRVPETQPFGCAVVW
jgi:thiol-disulfide isomerase/thioredoxin